MSSRLQQVLRDLAPSSSLLQCSYGKALVLMTQEAPECQLPQPQFRHQDGGRDGKGRGRSTQHKNCHIAFLLMFSWPEFSRIATPAGKYSIYSERLHLYVNLDVLLIAKRQ